MAGALLVVALVSPVWARLAVAPLVVALAPPPFFVGDFTRGAVANAMPSTEFSLLGRLTWIFLSRN